MNPHLKKICNEIYDHLGVNDPTPPPVDRDKQEDFVMTVVEDPVDVLRASDSENQTDYQPNPISLDNVEIQTTRQIIHRCRTIMAEGTFSEFGCAAVAKYDRVLAGMVESFLPPSGWTLSNDPSIAAGMCIQAGRYAQEYLRAIAVGDTELAAKYLAICAMHVTDLMLANPESCAGDKDSDIDPELKG